MVLEPHPVPDYLDLLPLTGRHAVVLGAGGMGIGRQASHALSQAGASLACVEVSQERAEEIASEVGALPLVADVTERAAMARLFDELDEHFDGRIDVLVDIVGVSSFAPLLDMEDAAWDSAFALVLRHAFLAMQLGGRRMAASGGGAMVFIGSASGLTASPLHAAYGAMKAGLMQLVRTGAQELGPFDIRVNAVAPGPVWTERVASMLGPSKRAPLEAVAPVGRVAEPSDIAAVILFLASDLSRHVTGQTITVDGGALIRTPFPDP
jgi:NAD(P)-dependent dehydrogenase (short-subunit alcohol dehydrogenase family)